MHNNHYVSRVVDLTDTSRNIIYNMTVDEARQLLSSGSPEDVRKIDGQFALVSVDGNIIHLARSIGRPLRYFIAKKQEGPWLIAADRIDRIHDYLVEQGLADQFHPSYTRMIPAHYVTEIALIGCPDPNPVYKRFFKPQRNNFSADIEEIGARYMQQVYDEIKKWLSSHATKGPVCVSFSGGIDSGSVFLLTYHAMLQLGMSPSRLKAFTLAVDGEGEDLEQARDFLQKNGLSMFLEVIEASAADVDWRETIKVVEDYKPLDIQAGAMSLALCRGIRERYPDWQYLIDGDGGDENLKDYPIEENPELTIRSVLNNLMLYHEGWGVDSIKHSLTYSGGLSRAYARTYAASNFYCFDGFSPYTLPNVIEIAEGIPFVELTNWDHTRLYDLKGQIVAAGVKAVTGMDMPVFEKRRFQHGATTMSGFKSQFPESQLEYRRCFNALYE